MNENAHINLREHFHWHVSRFTCVKFQTNLTRFRWITATYLGVHFFPDTVFIPTFFGIQCIYSHLLGGSTFCHCPIKYTRSHTGSFWLIILLAQLSYNCNNTIQLLKYCKTSTKANLVQIRSLYLVSAVRIRIRIPDLDDFWNLMGSFLSKVTFVAQFSWRFVH